MLDNGCRSKEALTIPREFLPTHVIHCLCFPGTSQAADSATDEIIVCTRRVVLCAISEQDDCLVEALLVILCLHQFKESLPSLDYTIINIHGMLLEFLSSIAFDHSVLLDFVVSTETAFDKFLLNYLELLSREKQDLVAACCQQEALFTDVSSTESSRWSSTSSLTLPEMQEASEQTPTAVKRLKLGTPSDGSSSNTSQDDQSTEPSSHCYQKLTGCLFRLHHSLTRTLHQQLVPQESKLETIQSITDSLDKFLDS